MVSEHWTKEEESRWTSSFMDQLSIKSYWSHHLLDDFIQNPGVTTPDLCMGLNFQTWPQFFRPGPARPVMPAQFLGLAWCGPLTSQPGLARPARATFTRCFSRHLVRCYQALKSKSKIIILHLWFHLKQCPNRCIETSQIKHKASITRRSAYDTGCIPMLDGNTQTLEQKLSGSRLASGDSNGATNVTEKCHCLFSRSP